MSTTASRPGAPAAADVASAVTGLQLFRPVAADYGRRAETFDGLGFGTAWLWAGVATTDGGRFAVLREHEVGSTSLYYGLELGSDIWSSPSVRQALIPGMDRLYLGQVAYEPEDTGHRITGSNPAYPGFTALLAPDTIHWVESDWLDLTYEPLGPAMRYRCPGRPDDFGYTSQICRVSGTVDGKPVDGFGGYDRSYHEPGVIWRQSKGFTALEEFWWVWAGVLEDGRAEIGWAIAGEHGFGLGAFHRVGEEPVAATNIDYEIRWEERGGRRLPAGATIAFGGRTFEYAANGNVTIPGADLFIDWMHGEMREQGGPEPVQRFSWLEFFKHLAHE